MGEVAAQRRVGGGEPGAAATGWGQPRFLLHLLAFIALLSLWTWKLLEPRPVPEELTAGLSDNLRLVLAKALHAGVYAFLTVLAVTLPVPRHWRWFLVGLMVWHGVATELAQYLMAVGRTGKATDVLIDWAGIALGVLAVRWWAAHRR